MKPKNRFQRINSASLCSLTGRFDNPIPPRCLAPIDFLKIPALSSQVRRKKDHAPGNQSMHYFVIMEISVCLSGLVTSQSQVAPWARHSPPSRYLPARRFIRGTGCAALAPAGAVQLSTFSALQTLFPKKIWSHPQKNRLLLYMSNR